MDEKDFEQAALMEEIHRETAILNARKKAVGSTRPENFDGTCPRCGADVQPERVALGYFECVDCSSEKELREKLTPRG